MTAFALHTASRPVAVVDLKWEQLDFEANVIYFNARPDCRKRRKKRPKVRMDPELKKLLLEPRDEAMKAKKLKHRVHAYVVEYRGYAVASIRRAFRNTAVEAGFNAWRPNLRHTAATWMAQDGVDLWEIAGSTGISIQDGREEWLTTTPIIRSTLRRRPPSGSGRSRRTQGPERQAGPADARSGPRNEGHRLGDITVAAQQDRFAEVGDFGAGREIAEILGKSDGGRYWD